jgi:precorrin-8X/cobalt-precorrin-8 methylmutase
MAAALAADLAEQRQPAVVLIGSAPTALEVLLEEVAAGNMPAPALVIAMPVGFVGVAESKRHLAASGLVHMRLEGSKGGAGLVAAACNALLRAGWLQAASAPSAPTPSP